MKKMRMAVSVFILISLMVLAGCSLFTPIANNTSSQKGSVKVSIQIPAEFLNGISEQFISHTITLAEMIVKVTKGAEVYTRNAAILTNSEVLFNSLSVGTWYVEVTAKDTEGFIVYSGQSSVNVAANTVTTTPVYLSVQTGNLDISVSYPSTLNVVTGQVSLINPVSLMELPQSLLIMGTTGNASYTQLHATTWRMKVQLFNNQNQIIVEEDFPVDVLPSRTMTANVSFDDTTGELNVNLTWQLLPQAPNTLNAYIVGDSVQLSWTASQSTNIAGYMLYKSSTLDGMKSYLTPTLLSGTEYIDSNIVFGETYYYWVQAYGNDGLCSDLTAAAPVTIGLQGKIIVEGMIDGVDLLMMNSDGTDVVNLTNDPVSDDFAAQWSPNGDMITYVKFNASTVDIFVNDLISGTNVNLTNSPDKYEFEPNFSPDGSKIVYRCDDTAGNKDVFIMNTDGSDVYNVTNTPLFEEQYPTFSPDGSKIMFIHPEGYIWQIYIIDSTGYNLTQIPTPSYLGVREIFWSPDGTKIAFSGAIVDTNGNWTQEHELWVINADGTNSIKLQTYKANPCYPSWSPDSQKIVFAADINFDYDTDLLVINADGTGLYQITENSNYIDHPEFTQDGQRIYFAGKNNNDDSIDILFVNADGSGIVQNITPNTPDNFHYPKLKGI